MSSSTKYETVCSVINPNANNEFMDSTIEEVYTSPDQLLNFFGIKNFIIFFFLIYNKKIFKKLYFFSLFKAIRVSFCSLNIKKKLVFKINVFFCILANAHK